MITRASDMLEDVSAFEAHSSVTGDDHKNVLVPAVQAEVVDGVPDPDNNHCRDFTTVGFTLSRQWRLSLRPLARLSRAARRVWAASVAESWSWHRVEVSLTTAADRPKHGAFRDRGRSERLPLATPR